MEILLALLILMVVIPIVAVLIWIAKFLIFGD